MTCVYDNYVLWQIVYFPQWLIEAVWYLNNSNILYSSQREIKSVVRSYALTHIEELNSTSLNNSNDETLTRIHTLRHTPYIHTYIHTYIDVCVILAIVVYSIATWFCYSVCVAFAIDVTVQLELMSKIYLLF